MKEKEKGYGFYRCGNCIKYKTKDCAQKGPVEATDDIGGCEDFYPRNALLFPLYLSEDDQERENPVYFFTRAISKKDGE